MPSAELIYSDSDHGADMLYATGVMVPDPFLWFRWKNRTHAVVPKLEFDRVRREARVDAVLASEEFLPPRGKGRGPETLLKNLAKKYGFRSLLVPAEFPFGLAEKLQKTGLKVRVKPGAFFPEREKKSAEELVKIRHALQLAETGLTRGMEILRASRIMKSGGLRWRGHELTAEILRGEIDATIMRLGGLPARTIVAGGEQACDPHEAGYGPLRAHEAIILDIFPRDQKTGYFGDLTRTVVRGKAGEKLRHLYQTVAEGKAWVLAQMKAGADGDRLHRTLTQRFTDAGYPTGQRGGRWVGFFHGTGHSLGLEIHEPPRFSAGKLVTNCVMTVEPGLYFPGLGGVRLEDLVVIRAQGVENFTTVPQQLEI